MNFSSQKHVISPESGWVTAQPLGRKELEWPTLPRSQGAQHKDPVRTGEVRTPSPAQQQWPVRGSRAASVSSPSSWESHVPGSRQWLRTSDFCHWERKRGWVGKKKTYMGTMISSRSLEIFLRCPYSVTLKILYWAATPNIWPHALSTRG